MRVFRTLERETAVPSSVTRVTLRISSYSRLRTELLARGEIFALDVSILASKKKERKKENRKEEHYDTMYKVAFLRLLFLNNSKRHSFAHRQGLQLLIERVSSLRLENLPILGYELSC